MRTIIKVAPTGQDRDTVNILSWSIWKKIAERAVICAVVAVVGTADLDSVDTNPACELSVVARPPRELGHGRLKSGQLLVFHFAEELWFIHTGLLLLLTASQGNLPQASV